VAPRGPERVLASTRADGDHAPALPRLALEALIVIILAGVCDVPRVVSHVIDVAVVVIQAGRRKDLVWGDLPPGVADRIPVASRVARGLRRQDPETGHVGEPPGFGDRAIAVGTVGDDGIPPDGLRTEPQAQ